MFNREKPRTDSLSTSPVILSEGATGLFLQIGKKEISFEVGNPLRTIAKKYEFPCDFPSVSNFNARSDVNPEKISICRVCQDPDVERHLIAPCNCLDTEKFVHESCLKYWLIKSEIPFELNKCTRCESSIEMNFEFTSPSFDLNSKEGLGILILLLFTLLFLCIAIFIGFSLGGNTDSIIVVCFFGFLAFVGFICILYLIKRQLKKSIIGWNIYTRSSIL